MGITKQQFLQWQAQIKTNATFRSWWVFWSNYSVILLLPVLALFYLMPEYRRLGLLAIAAFVVARFIVVPIIYKFYKKPRPYQQYGFEPITSALLSWRTAKHNSFPSRHVVSFATVAGCLFAALPLVAVYILLIGLFAGLGRMVLGYHDEKDVAGAIIVGLFVGFLANVIVTGVLLR